ncbi:AMP-binding protein [Embleya sp. NBC_00896]|uniref:AMP-binding protein n=1 Tax=Embleya sp. NBC_00896 TaxID=2975961 RepID=UPI003868403D|nr:AMP-binding protein [Embleya sp. NBC_00896]
MLSVEQGLNRPEYRDRALIEVVDRAGRAECTYTYGQIRDLRNRLAERLDHPPGTVVGLVAGNTPDWVVADLALLARDLVEVPVPLAFSAEQAESLLRGTAVCLVDEQGEARVRAWGLAEGRELVRIAQDFTGEAAPPAHRADPVVDRAGAADDVVKVIHTSGTTGVPKGVRIRRAGIEALLDALAEVLPTGIFDRYLSLVPFSLLIEQIAAVYQPIRVGGTLVLLPRDAALLGTAGSRAEEALEWLRGTRATAAVLPPAVVSVLDKAAANAGDDPVRTLFAATTPPFLLAGGAPVDPSALERLGALGIDVYEGYGLSENSSVVSWNRPSENAPGTVGRPLPHCEVRIGPEDELLVRSASLFAGYTVEDPTSRPLDEDGWLHTGDRASIDEHGRIRILGRLKNMIITSHGRNVSPEWVEGRLRSCPRVRDCVVFGDGLEHLVVVVLADPGATPDARWADAVRDEVSDFAARALAETDRPERVLVVADDAALRARYFTVTGRPRRDLLFTELVAPELLALASADNSGERR